MTNERKLITPRAKAGLKKMLQLWGLCFAIVGFIVGASVLDSYLCRRYGTINALGIEFLIGLLVILVLASVGAYSYGTTMYKEPK